MRVVSRNRQSRPALSGPRLRHIAEIGIDGDGAGLTVGVAFVDDAEMSSLHEQFSDDASTTDVLSFPGDPDSDDGYRGDIVVCADQAARQARELGIPYLVELGVLVLHGVLHLQGYDHTTDDGTMRRLEYARRPLALKGLTVRP